MKETSKCASERCESKCVQTRGLQSSKMPQRQDSSVHTALGLIELPTSVTALDCTRVIAAIGGLAKVRDVGALQPLAWGGTAGQSRMGRQSREGQDRCSWPHTCGCSPLSALLLRSLHQSPLEHNQERALPHPFNKYVL